jgi:CheY-like chemotaxis protein
MALAHYVSYNTAWIGIYCSTRQFEDFPLAVMRTRHTSASLGTCIAEGCDMRCLIVDDSADFRDAASAMLEGAGISVVGTASNGAEALERYETLHPDVALVDVELGDEDGFDVAGRLHEASSAESLVVIIVSTYDEADVADMLASSPAVGFVQKLELSPDVIRDLTKVTGPQGR